MNIELDAETKTRMQRAMEVEGWSSPAVVVRELLAKYKVEPAAEEEERRAGFTASELVALIAEAEAEPAIEMSLEELDSRLSRVIADVANRG